MSTEALSELIEFGLVRPIMVGGEPSFDAASIAVARACGRFASHGVQGRHLRSYKNAAEREAGFYEQLILPLLKQRNPKSRDRATESLEQLVDAARRCVRRWSVKRCALICEVVRTRRGLRFGR